LLIRHGIKKKRENDILNDFRLIYFFYFELSFKSKTKIGVAVQRSETLFFWAGLRDNKYRYVIKIVTFDFSDNVLKSRSIQNKNAQQYISVYCIYIPLLSVN